jgi:hypothetical protein
MKLRQSLRLSESSNRPGCDYDGDFFVASSNGSDVQDYRKRQRPTQIQCNSWILRGHLTIDEMHADSEFQIGRRQVQIAMLKRRIELQKLKPACGLYLVPSLKK